MTAIYRDEPGTEEPWNELGVDRALERVTLAGLAREIAGLSEEQRQALAEALAVDGAFTGRYAPGVQDFNASGTRTFTKSPNNPLIGDTDVAFGSLYWPWVLRVDSLIGSPRGTYYLWYSTDHAGASGAIGLMWANDLEGPWTDVGQVYQDTTSGNETETPSVMWDEANDRFIMYYQQNAPSGAVAAQVTLWATSTDGETWTRQGIAADIDNVHTQAAPAHTGYFRPFRIGGSWFAHSLLTGGDYPRFGLWYSDDGETWTLDDRPIGPGHEWVDNTKLIAWNSGSVVQIAGELWWVGVIASWAQASEARTTSIAMARIAPNLRSLISKPVDIITNTVAWEEDDFGSGVGVLVDGGKLWVFYQSRGGVEDQFGVAWTEVSA